MTNTRAITMCGYTISNAYMTFEAWNWFPELFQISGYSDSLKE